MTQTFEKSLTVRSSSQIGRDVTSGRFTTGNKMACGHRASTCRSNLAIFRSVITEEDIVQLAEVLKEKAVSGDLQAIRTLLDFVLPKPAAILAVDDKLERETEDESRRLALVANIGRQI